MIKLHDTNYVLELLIQLSRASLIPFQINLLNISENVLLVWKFIPLCTLIALKQLN